MCMTIATTKREHIGILSYLFTNIDIDVEVLGASHKRIP